MQQERSERYVSYPFFLAIFCYILLTLISTYLLISAFSGTFNSRGMELAGTLIPFLMITAPLLVASFTLSSIAYMHYHEVPPEKRTVTRYVLLANILLSAFLFLPFWPMANSTLLVFVSILLFLLLPWILILLKPTKSQRSKAPTTLNPHIVSTSTTNSQAEPKPSPSPIPQN